MTVRLTFLCVPGGGATTGPLFDDAPLSTHALHMAGATKTTLLPVHELSLRAPSARCTQAADALGLVAAPEPALRDLDLGGWTGIPLDDVATTARLRLTCCADARRLCWVTQPTYDRSTGHP
ncbi:hypothetical protein ACWDZX_27095, partial [Streptomyces collinus]